jgi:hypothetical protein
MDVLTGGILLAVLFVVLKHSYKSVREARDQASRASNIKVGKVLAMSEALEVQIVPLIDENSVKGTSINTINGQ